MEFLRVSGLNTKTMKDKARAADLLSDRIIMRAVGNWEDSLGDPVFPGAEGVEVIKVNTKRVVAIVDGEIDNIKASDETAQLVFKVVEL
jgi:hypothetical protein